MNRQAIVAIAITLVSFNTTIAQTSPKRLLGSFIFEKHVYNYEFTMEETDSYSLRISTLGGPSKTSSNVETPVSEEETNTAPGEITEDSVVVKPTAEMLTTTEQTNEETPEYVFNELTKEIFQRAFAEQMKVKFGKEGSGVSDAAAEVFFKIKAKLDFIDDEPVTAFLILKKDYVKSLLRANSSVYYKGNLSTLLADHYIHRVDVETEDGAIKNISVQMIAPLAVKSGTQSPRSFLLFKNQHPVSISGKFDYEKFGNVKLYCYDCSGIKGLSRYLRLSDLLILDIVYENDKDDYSPSNRVLSLTPQNPIAELKKERRSRLLEVAAFTDFVGLDRAEPNGLIQIEAKRRININTNAKLLFGKSDKVDILDMVDASNYKVSRLPDSSGFFRYRINAQDTVLNSSYEKSIRIPKSKFHSTYRSYLSYIEPRLLFSKLEENNRFVDSAKGANKILDPVSLYQYQLASFGITVQMFRLNFPQWKFQWNVLNVGGYWSRTRVALSTDSAGPSRALNIHYWEFSTGLIFRPDNRWGASVGYMYMKPRIWNPEYKLNTNRGLLQSQFDAFLRTGNDGKLFFRYRWTYEYKNRNNNFTQIQMGYSLNLFAGSSSR